MALNNVETQWIDRYYYNGIGLVKPARLPYDEDVYKKAVNQLLYQPVQKILGQAPTSETLQQVLKQIREVFPQTPFHMLVSVANAFRKKNDWKSDLTLACQSLAVRSKLAYCLVKNGVAFKTYVDKETLEPLGTFPYKTGYIAELEDVPDADVVAYLLSKDPMRLTDRECDIMRNIFKVDNNYNSRAKKVSTEVFQNGKFEVIELSPIGNLFPPQCLRDMWAILPEVTPYDSKHKQAYMYANEHPDEFPEALKYLKPFFEAERPTALSSTSPDDVARLKEGTFQMMESVPENTDEDQVIYNGINELLQDLVDKDLVRPCWTISQSINYYADEDAPEPAAYDPTENVISPTSAAGALEMLKSVLQKTGIPIFCSTVSKLLFYLQEFSEGREVHVEFAGTTQLAQQLIDSGMNPDLTLRDLVHGNTEPETKAVTAEKWIANGLDGKMTLYEVKDGHTQHKVAQIRTIGGLLNADTVHPSLKEVRKLIEHPIENFSTLVSVPFIDDTLRNKLLTTDTITSCGFLYKGLADKIIKALQGLGSVNEPTLSDVLDESLVPEELYNALITSEAAGVPVKVPKKELDSNSVYEFLREAKQNGNDGVIETARSIVGVTEHGLLDYIGTEGVSEAVLSAVKEQVGTDAFCTPTLSEESLYEYLQNKGADKTIANAAISGIAPEAYVRNFLQQQKIAPAQIEALFSGESEDAVLQAALLAKGFDRDTAAEILNGNVPLASYSTSGVEDGISIDAPGYKCIRSLIDGIFADMVKFDQLPYDDMMKGRMTIVPLFRNFSRVFGCDTKTTKPYVDFLTGLREKVEPNIQEHIDRALEKVK